MIGNFIDYFHLEEPTTKSFRWRQWRKRNFDIFDQDSSSLFDTWRAKYVVFKNLLGIRCCWQMCSENCHFHVFCPVCYCLPLDFPFSRKGTIRPLLLQSADAPHNQSIADTYSQVQSIKPPLCQVVRLPWMKLQPVFSGPTYLLPTLPDTVSASSVYLGNVRI